MKKLAIAAALFGAAFNLSANGVAATSNDAVEANIIAKFEQIGLSVTGAKPTPVAGLYEVYTNRGVIYGTADGKYLLQGVLLDLDSKENLTETSLSTLRTKGMEAFSDSMITYKAKNEKHKVTIFTDITCGYCRKLHRELDDYLDAGITVQYLAYPRYGAEHESAEHLRKIWCAEDAESALTKAKQFSGAKSSAGSLNPFTNQTPLDEYMDELDKTSNKTCKTSIKAQLELGQSLGISATPAIILEDGSLIPGYQPAAQLKQILDSNKS